jgi:ribosomal protein L9
MRILSLSLDEILKEAKDMEEENKKLRDELFKLSWYMRGGLSVEEAFYLSLEDREIIGKIVKENIETTKKSGLPFF